MLALVQRYCVCYSLSATALLGTTLNTHYAKVSDITIISVNEIITEPPVRLITQDSHCKIKLLNRNTRSVTKRNESKLVTSLGVRLIMKTRLRRLVGGVAVSCDLIGSKTDSSICGFRGYEMYDSADLNYFIANIIEDR